jgi:hypothetical protein
MSKIIRLTVDIETNDELGVPIEEIAENLTFYSDDAIDGYTISTAIKGYDNTWDFFIKKMTYVSREIIEKNATDAKEKYIFILPIGDWLADGHEICNYYMCEANKPVEEIREAHYRIKETTGVDIEKICSLSGNDSVDIELFKYLNYLGFYECYKDHVTEVIFGFFLYEMSFFLQ